MKILMVYPETPSTFYSFKNALKFISKKSAEPPLGLLTVAAMLPPDWDVKLIDMNVDFLEEKHILWADYVFLSGMNIHKASFMNVVKRCNQLGIKTVAGGPMVTSSRSEFLGVDHFVLNEAEITLPVFLKDLAGGKPKKVYSSKTYPDISKTPPPRWDLLNIKKYANMSIQYSRGCPYDCEFCSITVLNGRIPRTKSREQFIGELNTLYNIGWRGGVFIVDDNFIGNKKKLKEDILPAIIEWSKARKHPYQFSTEVSLNLADDDELLDLMEEAGFLSIFVGIETPNEESLSECGKKQNLKRDIAESVHKIQNHGLVVSGGFIVGFDHDTPNIFRQQINFIQRSGIVTAMVGLLNAPDGTKLFQRMIDEERLICQLTGDNMDCSINFVPAMGYQILIKGYKEILDTIYSQKEYYERVKTFLNEFHRTKVIPCQFSLRDISAFLKSIWYIGLREKGKRYYWKLLFLSLFRHPKKFSLAMTMAVYGFHFRRIVEAL